MGTQKQYTQEFKQDAVDYRNAHPELSLKDCAVGTGFFGKKGARKAWTVGKWILLFSRQEAV